MHQNADCQQVLFDVLTELLGLLRQGENKHAQLMLTDLLQGIKYYARHFSGEYETTLYSKHLFYQCKDLLKAIEHAIPGKSHFSGDQVNAIHDIMLIAMSQDVFTGDHQVETPFSEWLDRQIPPSWQGSKIEELKKIAYPWMAV